MCTLSLNYIGYFYYVFPLHLNSFNTFFYNKLYRHSTILQRNIHVLLLDLYLIRGIKSKLDSLSSDTIKFLDLLDFHLNTYQKPNQENLKSIVDFFVKILIDAIDHEIDYLTTIYSFLSVFHHIYKNIIHNIKNYYKYSLSKLYIPILDIFRLYPYDSLQYKIVKNIYSIESLLPRFHDYESVFQYVYYINIYKLSVKDIKCKLESFKKPLQSISTSQTDYLNQIKQKLNIIGDSKNNYYLGNIQELQAIKSSLDALNNLNNNMKVILTDIKHFKDIMTKLRDNIDFESDTISREKFFKKYAMLQITYGKTETVIKSFDFSINQIKSRIMNKFSRSISLVNEIILDVDALISYIPNLRKKLLNAKSKLNKRKLIEYIINLIDEIKFIMRVEPSEIVDHLKKIHPIKPELESIVNSIKTTDIQRDISNLQNLYSEILDIESFSRNMKKLKDYIKSVESHLEGMDYIFNNLKRIKNLIDFNCLELILFYLDLYYCTMSQNESKLETGDPVRKYMDQIKDHIFILKYLVCMIYQNINKIEPLVNKLKRAVEFIGREMNVLKSDVTGIECAIEGVARNLIWCSVQTLTSFVETPGNQDVPV